MSMWLRQQQMQVSISIKHVCKTPMAYKLVAPQWQATPTIGSRHLACQAQQYQTRLPTRHKAHHTYLRSPTKFLAARPQIKLR